MAQLPDEEKCVNFTGSWTLRTSEKLDEYLKDEGWGLIMRKAAAAVNAYQTIQQTDDEIKIKVKNKKGTYEYTAKLDGKTEIEYQDMDKGINIYISHIRIIILYINRYSKINK